MDDTRQAFAAISGVYDSPLASSFWPKLSPIDDNAMPAACKA
jgi:hypothetical protein